ncbi:uncharacterized protein LOC141726109 isoform X1 [Zonotrichia albicollis]|uniref:uncharacterized protein LOC141726109 isoform X1 n=1 Tax=Zonotrichia albicollis TaxID=44394 RepID=UPI003D80BE42
MGKCREVRPLQCHLDREVRPLGCHLNREVRPLECHLDREVRPLECHLDREMRPLECHLDREMRPLQCHLDRESPVRRTRTHSHRGLMGSCSESSAHIHRAPVLSAMPVLFRGISKSAFLIPEFPYRSTLCEPSVKLWKFPAHPFPSQSCSLPNPGAVGAAAGHRGWRALQCDIKQQSNCQAQRDPSSPALMAESLRLILGCPCSREDGLGSHAALPAEGKGLMELWGTFCPRGVGHRHGKLSHTHTERVNGAFGHVLSPEGLAQAREALTHTERVNGALGHILSPEGLGTGTGSSHTHRKG